jgi:GNAT superfamily N-acetyltransferase
VDLVIASLADRPDLADRFYDFDDLWPTFLQQDPVGSLFYARATTTYAAYSLLALDADDPEGRPVARSSSVPFAMGEDLGRGRLPDDGWDGVIRWAWLDEVHGRTPTHVSALEVAIRPDLRGSGLASVLLDAKRHNLERLGFTELVAPVRPSGKHLEPRTPMTEYAARTRDDGLPVDPWLRLHVRIGAEVVGVCPRAMTVSGTLGEWREWTGLPFDTTGDVEVPLALNPVHCSVEHDHAVYVEPGVWVRHRLGAR